MSVDTTPDPVLEYLILRQGCSFYSAAQDARKAGPARNVTEAARAPFMYAVFHGDRAPRLGSCVGCGKAVSTAWRVEPYDITVAACNGDCVADRIEREWKVNGEFAFYRLRGQRAIDTLTGGLPSDTATVDTAAVLAGLEALA